MKNKDYIIQINDLLNEMDNNVDLISFESTYHSIIVISQKICKLTLEFQLKNEAQNSLEENMRPMHMILVCEREKIIPRHQIKNLHKIRMLNNQVIHGEKPTYQDVYSLLNTFSKYITWFDSSYLDNYYLKKKLKTESVLSKIASLPKPQKEIDKNENGVKPTNFKNVNRIYKANDSKLTKQEEEHCIDQINGQLGEYEKQLTSISPEKNYYFVFVGQNIIESMLKLLIRKKGYQISENFYNFYKMIYISYENQIIPKECYEFLNLIRRYRNEFAHEIKTPDKLIISFLNAFSSFIQWYDNYFSQLNNSESPFKIKNCYKLIDELNYEKSNIIISPNISSFRLQKSMSENHVKQKSGKQKVAIRDWMGNIIGYNLVDEEGNIVDEEDCFEVADEPQIDDESDFRKINKNAISKKFSEYNEIRELKSEIQRKEELFKKEQLEKEKLKENEKTLKRELAKKDEEIKNNKRDYDLKMDLILKNLAENSKMFEKCMDIFIEHVATAERIETKIDAIDEKINHLTNQISAIQSLTERQIKNATSQEHVERIFEDFMDECIEKIMSVSSKMMENENYEREKRKLIRSMGESAWMKLSERSKSFLITSKVMYNDLIMIDDIIDYSGICVLVTKALEVEIHKRFFTGFLDYLHEKYGNNYKKYPSALLYQYKTPLFADKFTMGNIAFVLCHIENRNDTLKQKANNKEKLMEYCKSRIFSKYGEDEIKELLDYYASSIEKIRIKYRNPSAHTNEIKQIDAEECFDLVLDVEKLLKEMLDSFDT